MDYYIYVENHKIIDIEMFDFDILHDSFAWIIKSGSGILQILDADNNQEVLNRFKACLEDGSILPENYEKEVEILYSSCLEWLEAGK